MRWDHGEPFGNSPANENPSGLGTFGINYRFPGQYLDKASNTHYNYFRDYGPAEGRYIQSDPIGLAGGVNTYLYANGNPLIFVDPDGRLSQAGAVLLAGTVGAVFEGGATLIQNINSGAPLTQNLASAALGGFVEGTVIGVVAIAPGPAVATIGLTTALFPSTARLATGIILGIGANTILVGKVLGAPIQNSQQKICP